MPDDKPKIIIDEDWKSQVEAEKEAASQSEPQAPAADDGGDSAQAGSNDDPPMPPASFAMLLSSLATEAMMSLGQMPHPMTGEVAPRRNQAKYLIDTIEMLREKTLGNVPAEESAGVEQLLHQLRMAFVGMQTDPTASDPESRP